jgi:ribonucleotide monophosphatase NagD (HAD superfamily)
MDIKAALDAGAHALGVTTGIFSRQELLDAVPPGEREAGNHRKQPCPNQLACQAWGGEAGVY